MYRSRSDAYDEEEEEFFNFVKQKGYELPGINSDADVTRFILEDYRKVMRKALKSK